MNTGFATRISRIGSAYRGVYVFLRKTPHAWIRIVLVAFSIVGGCALRVSAVEWGLITLAGGLIVVAEIINTAIEIAVDLASPARHPLARDAKDVAAGAALVSTFVALVLWTVVFTPHLSW